MDEQFTYSVGKIHCGTKDGSLFLISPIIAITALHVVDEALRCGEEIKVDFPILDSEEVIKAKVIYPTSVEGTDLPDIAVLELSRSLEVSHLKLARVNVEQDIEWKSFGYPITKEEKGQFFKGTVALTRSDCISYQYDIDLFCVVPNLTDTKYSATGASGSPIMIGDYVVGVLTDAMPGSTIGMVGIIHIQSLLAEQGVKLPFLGNLGIYYNDIEKLRDYTKMLADTNSDYSRLWINNEEVKIERECVNVIQNESENGSLLVIGEPGSGKSGALRDLVVSLIEEQRDVVFLDVGHISAEGIGALRGDLGLSVDLNRVLENWLGEQPGYIVIDALDAARSERSAQVLRTLIAYVNRKLERWRIVASVRKFDLRHDNELRRLFRGNTLTEYQDYQDPEFFNLRHIHIPAFGEEEILEICNSAPIIASFLKEADETMRNLICSPFNLRLIGELLDEGIKESELVPIRTQRELLDRYWSYRVIRRDGQRDAREILLTNTVKEMVATRTLKAARNLVVEANTSGALDDLLSTNVLIEWQSSVAGRPSGYKIAFSHHILFDFAVYRLMLQEDSETVENLLLEHPELVLVIRPSVVYNFTNLWFMEESRSSFWNLVYRLIEADKLPEVAKLIGPSLAVELGHDINDFTPLFQRLITQDTHSHEVAAKVLNHLIGGFVVAKLNNVKVEFIDLWSEIVELLSSNISLSTKMLHSVRFLLTYLCEMKFDFSVNQINRIGIASRRFLEEVIDKPEHDWTINSAITCVCRTFSSHIDESERLLRKFLDPERIKERGYKELPALARELPMLYKYSPSFVKDVYCSAFLHEENSKEVTSLGASQILPLQSNRRQDFNHVLWQLSEDFLDFLENAPLYAVHTLINVIDNYVLSKHSSRMSEKELSFEYGEKKGTYRSDLSYIWDTGSYNDDNQLKMLNSFQKYMIKFGNNERKKELRTSIVNLLLTHNKSAVIWKRLIKSGNRCPESLGYEIRELAWAIPILIGNDTSKEIGDLITVIYPFISRPEREKIEVTILSTANECSLNNKEVLQNTVKKLIGCIPSDLVESDEAKQFIEQSLDKGGLPSNNALFHLEWEDSDPLDENESLKEQGVPIEEKENQHIQRLKIPIKEFIERSSTSAISIGDIEIIMPTLQELKSSLDLADEKGVHERLQEHAWDNLTKGCSIISNREEVLKNLKIGQFVKEVVIKCSQHCKPVLHPGEEEAFENSVGWGIPAPRIQAAIGVINIAKYETYMDEELKNTIKSLITDPVPAVRFNLVSNLKMLCENHEDFMWEMIMLVAQNESNYSILRELVASSLFPLINKNNEKVMDLLTKIYYKTKGERKGGDLRNACLTTFLNQFLEKEDLISRNIIYSIIERPQVYFGENLHLISSLRSLLVIGSVEQINEHHNKIRNNSWELLEGIVSNTLKGYKELQSSYKDKGQLADPESQQINDLARIADSACKNVYFASGAYDEKKQQEKNNALTVFHKRFWEEACAVMEMLSEFGIPSITHKLLQTLEFLAPLNPSVVFKQIGKVVMSGEKGGYQFESLGVSLIVKLIERYLAEFRSIFIEESDNGRILLLILDVFVTVGWPESRRLTYRLDQLFR
ncbi:ATP-binding protein [Bacillus safensis]|uniref:ATP-binding protein n=1 Tax=Bacillus safensis TaxID=561879 RepID=UPI000F85EBAB|nr:ATP-binding protein [Bacillus safensis]MBU5206333.1 hypothetical protein [Bacillus safensis]RUK51186.1 ATP-binding protein [Bacillus safensis]